MRTLSFSDGDAEGLEARMSEMDYEYTDEDDILAEARALDERARREQAHARVAAYPEPCPDNFWTTRDGYRIRVDHMSDDHLVNALRFATEDRDVPAGAWYTLETIDAMTAELKRRGLLQDRAR